jgi:hypothetical protein
VTDHHAKDLHPLSTQGESDSDLPGTFADGEDQQTIQTDCREQQRADRKSSQDHRAEASWSNRLANAIDHCGDRLDRELPIDTADLGADGRYEDVRIGVGTNGQLELPSKCVRKVVQHAIGKLAERLVGVNGRLGSERAIGDVGNNADYGEPGILVFRDVEPPSEALADGILSGPEGPCQPLVDDDDTSRLDFSTSENTRPLFNRIPSVWK